MLSMKSPKSALVVPTLVCTLFCVPLTQADDRDGSVAPSGEYVVTAIRRSGMVESTVDAEPEIGSLLGLTATFSDSFHWIDGSSCESWSASDSTNDRVDLYDPNLSDLAIEKLQPPAYEVFSFVRSFDLFCDGDTDPVANVTNLDGRVLVTVSDSGSFNVILEKPLSESEVRRLQEQLKDMKFYEGDVTGVIDESTRAAISGYADYRGAEYRFKDAVITGNLLDGLNVLE